MRGVRFAGRDQHPVPHARRAPVIFEINPRFSGGIPLTIQAGADFPADAVKLAMGGGGAGDRRVPGTLWMTSFESSFFLTAPRCGLGPFDTAASGR